MTFLLKEERNKRPKAHLSLLKPHGWVRYYASFAVLPPPGGFQGVKATAMPVPGTHCVHTVMHTLGQNRDLIHIHRAHLKTQGTFAICDSVSLGFTASVPKSIGSSTASTTASLIHPTTSCIRSPVTSILIFLSKWMAFSSDYYLICLPLVSQGNKKSYPGLLTGEQYQNTFFFR